MTEIVFFDTNILVYLFDSGSPAKQKRAQETLERATQDGNAVISTQVLQELYVTITRKLATPVDEETAEQAVRDLSVLPVVAPDTSMILGAISRSTRTHISFWDSLIIEAALVSGANRLLSEDFQHGYSVNGMKIENPFL